MSSSITLRFLAAPTDVTASGDRVQAGRVLEWIDKAGYACAVGWSGRYCVTAYVGNVHFTRAIVPGDLIEARARVIHTGRTSMQILVTVRAADPRDGLFAAATHCILVFVAIDEKLKPTEIPQWTPVTDVDRELNEHAIERIEMRKHIHDEMRRQNYSEEGTGPRTVLRFLATPADANFGGNAHGGTVMGWIDEAAYACAVGWSGRETVAVYSGGIHFYRPVHIGDLVEVEARLIHTGSRSMHLNIRVRSGELRTGELHLTTQCMSIFVVVGADGRAEEVPQLSLLNPEDIRLDAHARDLIAMRASLAPVTVPD